MVAGNSDRGQPPIGKTTPSFEDVQSYINKNYDYGNRNIVAIVNKQGDVLADLSKMSAAEKDAAVKKWLASGEEVSFKLQGTNGHTFYHFPKHFYEITIIFSDIFVLNSVMVFQMKPNVLPKNKP